MERKRARRARRLRDESTEQREHRIRRAEALVERGAARLLAATRSIPARRRKIQANRATVGVLFRGLSVTRAQRDALQQVFASNLKLPGFTLRAERVEDERRAVLEFSDGHTVAIRPNGDPA